MANVKATDLIDFTRASKGHALAKVSYGSELVENGTFDTDLSGWTTQSGGSTFTVSSGQLTISRSAVDPGYVYQIISTTAGNVYYVTFGVIDNGPIDLRVGTSPAGLQIASSGIKSSAGTYTLAFVATGASTYISLVNTSYSTDATIDNISVREVTFDQPNGTLQLFEHPVGIPRIEYDADGNLLGLLIEESRTNLLPYSEDFSNAEWVKNAGTTVTTNYATSPDGTENATRYLGTGLSGFADKQTLSAGTYTLSFWVKSNTGQNQFCRLVGESDKTSDDLLVTTAWQRLEHTFTATGGTNKANGIFRDSSENDIDILVYGAQLEAGAFPTSYIKTTGSTATRSADVASIPVSDFGYNQSEGTLLVQCQHFTTETGATAAAAVALDDGSSNNRMWYYQNKGQWIGSSGGATQFSIIDGDLPEDTEVKAGLVYSKDDFAMYVDGSSAGTDTSGSVAVGVTTLHIGKAGGATVPLNGHIKSIKYIPKRLSNAKLQELTS